jgi:hypothetical protein
VKTKEKESTLTEYLKGIGLEIDVVYDFNDDAPQWARKMNHYFVTLTLEGREMELWFYQGTGITEEPTLERVIECLALDRTYAQMTLKEYGREFGWSEDTVATHESVVSQNEKYERLIDDEDLLEKIYEKVTA